MPSSPSVECAINRAADTSATAATTNALEYLEVGEVVATVAAQACER